MSKTTIFCNQFNRIAQEKAILPDIAFQLGDVVTTNDDTAFEFRKALHDFGNFVSQRGRGQTEQPIMKKTYATTQALIEAFLSDLSYIQVSQLHKQTCSLHNMVVSTKYQPPPPRQPEEEEGREEIKLIFLKSGVIIRIIQGYVLCGDSYWNHERIMSLGDFNIMQVVLVIVDLVIHQQTIPSLYEMKYDEQNSTHERSLIATKGISVTTTIPLCTGIATQTDLKEPYWRPVGFLSGCMIDVDSSNAELIFHNDVKVGLF
jgi:hypothetical protein